MRPAPASSDTSSAHDKLRIFILQARVYNAVSARVVSRFEALQADEEPAGDHEPAIAPLDADPLPRGVPDDLDERHHGCASGSPYEAAVVPVDGAEAIADAVGSRFTHAAVVHAALDPGRVAPVVPRVEEGPREVAVKVDRHELVVGDPGMKVFGPHPE